MEEAITLLAKRDEVPAATKAVELLKEALEREEDMIWDAIATEREAKGGKFLSHDEVWK